MKPEFDKHTRKFIQILIMEWQQQQPNKLVRSEQTKKIEPRRVNTEFREIPVVVIFAVDQQHHESGKDVIGARRGDIQI